MNTRDHKINKEDLLEIPEIELSGNETLLSLEEQKQAQHQRILNKQLNSIFSEVHLQSDSKLDLPNFDKRLLNLIQVKEPVIHKPEKENWKSWFSQPVIRYGVIGALVVAIAIPVISQFIMQSDTDSTDELVSAIPMLTENELEEADWDDVTAELIGTSVDAFVYGERSIDDISWDAPDLDIEELAYGNSAPVNTLETPDQVPTDPELALNVDQKSRSLESQPASDFTSDLQHKKTKNNLTSDLISENLWKEYHATNLVTQKRRILNKLKKHYKVNGSKNDLLKIQRKLLDLQ